MKIISFIFSDKFMIIPLEKKELSCYTFYKVIYTRKLIMI